MSTSIIIKLFTLLHRVFLSQILGIREVSKPIDRSIWGSFVVNAIVTEASSLNVQVFYSSKSDAIGKGLTCGPLYNHTPGHFPLASREGYNWGLPKALVGAFGVCLRD